MARGPSIVACLSVAFVLAGATLLVASPGRRAGPAGPVEWAAPPRVVGHEYFRSLCGGKWQGHPKPEPTESHLYIEVPLRHAQPEQRIHLRARALESAHELEVDLRWVGGKIDVGHRLSDFDGVHLEEDAQYALHLWAIGAEGGLVAMPIGELLVRAPGPDDPLPAWLDREDPPINADAAVRWYGGFLVSMGLLLAIGYAVRRPRPSQA
jgi:hypothetical protein